MSLTPTQLEELQTIVETLRTEFSSSDDDLWQAAIRLQKGGLGPVTGTGGQPAFDAAVAEIVLESEQISTVQGRQGGIGQSFDIATFNVVPIEGELPAGSVGDVIYIDTAPSTYLATDVVSLTPAGPNSVILSEIGTQVARTVGAGSGGLEVNNLSTGAGFERVLTVSDMGGSGINVEDEGVPLPGTATTLNFVGAGVTASGAGATKTITIPGSTGPTILPGTADGETLDWNNGLSQWEPSENLFTFSNGIAVRESASSNTGLFLQNSGGVSDAAIIIDQLGAEALTIENRRDLGPINFQGRDSGSGTVTLTTMTPEGAVVLYSDNSNVMASADHGINLFGLGAGGVTNTRIEFLDALPTGNRNYVIGALGLNQFNLLDELVNRPLRIAGTDGGGTVTYMIATPNGDTLLRGQTGLRLESQAGVIEMEPGGNGFFTFNNAGQLNLLGNGTQSGVLNFTEGTSPFASVAGEGQLWVRDDTPNVLVFRDDTGVDTVLGAGAPAGTDEQTLVYVGTTLTATDFFQHDNQNVITIEDQFAATHNWNYNVGGGGRLEFTSTSISDTIFPVAVSIAEGGGGSGEFSINYNGNLITMNADESSTLRVGNSTSGISIVEMFQGTRIRFLEVGGLDPIEQWNDGTHLRFDLSDGGIDGFRLDGNASIYLNEQAAAEPDIAGYGQLFVRDDTPNSLIFRDDAGNETDLTAGGSGAQISGTPANNQVAVWTNATDIEGDANFTFDGANLVLGNAASLYLDEKAAAGADTTGQGQLWCNSNAFSQSLYFTPDNGNDLLLAHVAQGDLTGGVVLISGTGFVGVINFGPRPNEAYILNAVFEVTAPAADDMNVQLTIDSNSRFKGIITYSGSGITNDTATLEGGAGDVVTNTVTVPTSGNATPDGTYCTIVGILTVGNAPVGTHSIRFAKNADTGVDGRVEFTAGGQLTPIND